MRSNAELGMTIQKIVCDKYGITPCSQAANQFQAAFNSAYKEPFEKIVDELFQKIGSLPVKCLTYEHSENDKRTVSPHNFLLASGETLSFRTNIKGDKIAPRTVGQAGLATFNDHFHEIIGRNIEDKQEIKKVIIHKIDRMLPVFVDYFFVSDYTVWLQWENNTIPYTIIDNKKMVDINYERRHFSFTRELADWNESTTLKYHNHSLAEIQIHRNRSFKFRFVMGTLITLFKDESRNNETLGITAEKVICDHFHLPLPKEYKGRSSIVLERKIKPVVSKAFRTLPKAVESTGAKSGERGKNSKCSYDFLLEGGKQLSVKTNTGKMVCPPEVGQPGADTCMLYFQCFTDAASMTNEVFKKMVFVHIADLLPIYLHHLFDSDYLLWIYQDKDKFSFKIFDSAFGNKIEWKRERFSFTKSNLEEWNESNTVKYDGISIGEFQVHQHRSCFKFRFNLENLEKLARTLTT